MKDIDILEVTNKLLKIEEENKENRRIEISYEQYLKEHINLYKRGYNKALEDVLSNIRHMYFREQTMEVRRQLREMLRELNKKQGDKGK